MSDGAKALVGAVVVFAGVGLLSGGRDADLAAAWQAAEDDLQAAGASTPAPAPFGGRGRLVVDLRDDVGDAALAKLTAAVGAPARWLSDDTRDEALAVVDDVDLVAAAAALAGWEDVEVAEPSVEYAGWEPLAGAEVAAPPARIGEGGPDDPLFPAQWHLRAAGAPAGWAATPMGRGVVVAVLDTGVSPVEDLQGTTLLPGASFVPEEPTTADGHGHGTHVAGTIAQTTNNGVGCAGMAPAASILPVKVLGARGGGTSEGIAAGIDWAVDHGAQVINLSLGGPAYSAVIHNAAKKARAAGVLVVAAAGNEGRLGVSWPGALREVIGVSAVGPDGALAPYSSYGPGVDVAGPGGDTRVEGGGVLQDTVAPGGHAYKAMQGTSMATPHVSGALAALLSTGLVSPLDAERVLLLGADGALWDPRFGHGRLDVGRALEIVGAGQDRRWRFGLGAALGWVVAAAATRAVGFRLVAALLAGVVAGGAWFATGLAPSWATVGALHWPMAWAGLVWGWTATWGACLAPLAGVVLLAPFRPLRAPVIGGASGLAVGIAWAAWRGALAPAWIPMASWWFGVQVVVCVAAALVAAGVHRLDGRGADA